MNFDPYLLDTPYYIIDEKLLRRNLEILSWVRQQSGCRILLAQKAFSMFALYPLIGEYLDGTTASGLFEARLGAEEMGKENHIFSPAYQEADFAEIVQLCDHIVFNSLTQWQKYFVQAAGRSCGLRINPEHSTQAQDIYDPCAPGSRLGITRQNFPAELPPGIEGLHFHTLCEQNADALLETVAAIEQKFAPFLPQLKWLNLGGGHHITRKDYDTASLLQCLEHLQSTYQLQVYLEPGEAVALNCGFLVTSVLDIVHNELDNAIVDTSAACHMPDVLEMPYRPPLLDAAEPQINPYTYRLGGPTCLAGDIIGDYSFDHLLTPGERLIFGDMAIYSMVKNNTFNGLPLPTIAIARENGQVEIVKQFSYLDFKNRLS